MELDDILNNAGFWLLGGGAVSATVIGYIMAKRMDMMPLPIWQLIAMIVVEIVAAAYFSNKD